MRRGHEKREALLTALDMLTSTGHSEVVAAAAAELGALPKGVRLIDVGAATLVAERSDALLTAFDVRTGDHRLGSVLLTRLYLASAAAGTAQYPVIDAGIWEGDRLEVLVELDIHGREALGLQSGATALRLYAQSSDTFVVRTLHERLSSNEPIGLAPAMISAVQDRPETAPAALPGSIGLIVGNDDARRPMLAGVLADLVSAGRTALVVSNDNAALDALLPVFAARRPVLTAGQVVRVGMTGSPVVGRDQRFTPEGAARLDTDLAARLDAMAADLTPVLPPVTVYEPPAVPGASRQTSQTAPATSEDEHSARLGAARRALALSDQTVGNAVSTAQQAAKDHAAARKTVREVEASRLVYQHAEILSHRVEGATAETFASASGLARIASEPSTLGKLVAAATVATTRLDRRDRALAELEQVCARLATLPHSRADVAAADAALLTHRAEHASAERLALHARAERAKAARVVRQLVDTLPAPPATARPEPAIAAGAAPEPANDLAPLRVRHEAVRSEVREAMKRAVAEAPVLVTTFAQLVANPVVFGRRFDHVIVENAGAVPLAQLVWAAGRADRSLTVALAAEPQHPASALPLTADPLLRRWFGAGLLVALGMDDIAVRRQLTSVVEVTESV